MDKQQTAKQQTETMKQLIKLRNEVFKGSDSQLALALGRPLDEVEAWQRETAEIDEDAELKIINLAEERLSG